MITPTSSVPAASAGINFTFTPTGSSTSTDSFAQQLASALEGFLGQAVNGSGMEIDIAPQQSQNSGASQFVVTVQDLGSAGAAAPSTGSTPAANSTASASSTAGTGSSTASTASDATYTGTMAGMVASAASVAASAALHGLSSTASATPAPAPLETATDAYWAMQPPAVQALQNMPLDQRPAAALALAQQGYTIDVPIMVDGWDPLVTMDLRQSDGYTWVPSALQPNIQVAPGLTFPGLPSYDAANPPPGSIIVSTAFANGTSGDTVVDAMNRAEAADPFTS